MSQLYARAARVITIQNATINISADLEALNIKVQRIMASLDETLAAVTAANTKTDSLIALFKGLKAQLADVLSGVTLPPAVQAKIDAMFAEANASVAEVDEAITENVPPTP
jgi:altronate dehydratase